MSQVGAGVLIVACECCEHSYVNGVQQHAPAAYRWTHPRGNTTNVCVSCCAHWRQNAKDDPDLMPQRIETIPPIPISDVTWERH